MNEKPRLLIVPAFRIYPTYSGGAVAQTCFLNEYIKSFETHICLTSANVNSQNLTEFTQKYKGLHIHYLKLASNKKTENRLKAKFSRLWALIVGQFTPTNSSENSSLLSELVPANQEYINYLSKIFEKKSFDIVLVEVFRNLSITPFLPKEPLKVYVSQEVQFLRIQSQLKALGKTGQPFEKYIENYQESIEKPQMAKYDGIIVFSEQEAERHRKYFGQPIKVSPFTAPDRLIPKIALHPKKIVLLGAESHIPNKEGIEWLLENGAVALKKIKLPIYIVGNWSLSTTKKWKKRYGVQFTGIVDDLDQFMVDAIHLAPVRFGGGLKTKVMEAMKLGVPTVATTHATEGLPVENYKHLIITDSVKGFVDNAMKLVENGELRSSLSENSVELMNSEFSVTKLGKLRVEAIKDIYKEIKQVDI